MPIIERTVDVEEEYALWSAVHPQEARLLNTIRDELINPSKKTVEESRRARIANDIPDALLSLITIEGEGDFDAGAHNLLRVQAINERQMQLAWNLNQGYNLKRQLGFRDLMPEQPYQSAQFPASDAGRVNPASVK